MALRLRLGTSLALLAVIALLSSGPVIADEPPSADDTAINIPRPDEHDLVVDLAHLLKATDEREIQEITARLVADKAIPIVVVTIESMKAHSPFNLRIETFANLLFDQWQIGAAEIDGQEWNRGILLLVSKGDRKARIELGGGWRRDQDRECQRIMQDKIVPHFKRNDYSGGILAGVKALDALARDQTKPRAAAAPGGLPGGTPPALVPPSNTPQQPAPQGAAAHVNRPMPQLPQQFPRAWPHPAVQPPRASNGFALAVLVIIGVVVFLVIGKAVSAASGMTGARRRGFGARHVTNDSWWGGPFGWQNWALYEMSRQNWQQNNSITHHSTSHFSDSAMSHGGGFSSSPPMDTSSSSSSSFGGGSSGGGGATGSW
ncbi:MAG TPA: TPM domain-containing protein [Pirellulales bacterium]|nr:TPM domain-containing protein [Pirellulales bacterium]